MSVSGRDGQPLGAKPPRPRRSLDRAAALVASVARHQLVRFLVVGVLNTLLGFAIIFACMYLLKLSPVASNVIGYTFGLLLSYLLNKRYTFKSASTSKLEPARFAVVFLVSYAANLGVLLACIDWLGLHAALAQVAASVVYVGTSFLLNKYYTFAERDSPSLPP